MADLDFNITIKTVADTTGIRLTKQGLDEIKVAAIQGNQQAIAALQNLTAASRQAAGAGASGFAGSAIGIGTITTLLGFAINRTRSFMEEQDKILEKMAEVTRRNYELAQSILATKDSEIEARRLGTEPLADSYIRLQQKLISLKTEQNALNLPNQSKEWQELQKDINETGKQIDDVKSKLQKAGIKDVTPTSPGPKAGKGESQELVDEIERNRKAAEDALKEDVWEFDPETGGMRRTGQKQFPIFQPPPAPADTPGFIPNPSQYRPGEIGPGFPKGGGATSLIADMIEEAVKKAVDRYWGP